MGSRLAELIQDPDQLAKLKVNPSKSRKNLK